MKTGISKEIWNEIISVFEKKSKIKKVYLFGSRAIGSFREGSDIDLAIKGENLELKDLLDIESSLEDLGLLYNFDIVNYNQLTNRELKAHIDRVGMVVYKKKKINPTLTKNS